MKPPRFQGKPSVGYLGMLCAGDNWPEGHIPRQPCGDRVVGTVTLVIVGALEGSVG